MPMALNRGRRSIDRQAVRRSGRCDRHQAGRVTALREAAGLVAMVGISVLGRLLGEVGQRVKLCLHPMGMRQARLSDEPEHEDEA